MTGVLYSIAGILIPFLGTSLGSSLVFFMKKDMNEKFRKLIVGFAAGVMIAASVWSLIIPSVEMAETQGNSMDTSSNRSDFRSSILTYHKQSCWKI